MQSGSATVGNFYNNTIANFTSTTRAGLAFWAGGTTKVEYRNNIARNLASGAFTNIGVAIASHNYLSSVPIDSEFNTAKESNLQQNSLDPFVDSGRNYDGEVVDWQLSGTNLPNAGYSLPAPYNESCLNRLWQGPNAVCITRGADGYWDRGAIEYASSPIPVLNPPTNLHVIPQ